MEKIFFYDTPVGHLCIGEENGSITRVTWNQISQTALTEETETIRRCKEQLDAFFAGERKNLTCPSPPKARLFSRQSGRH